MDALHLGAETIDDLADLGAALSSLRSLTAIFAKVGVDELAPSYATLIRTGVILVIVAGLWVASGAPTGGALGSVRVTAALVLSGAATGATWLCYFQALKLGDASHVVPLDKLSVVLVAIFAACFLGERLDQKGWAGVILIGSGAMLLAFRR